MNEQNNTPNETNESSTSSILSHSAQILQAASPYLDENTKQTLESVVHVTDFLETIQNFRTNGFNSLFSGLFGRRKDGDDTVSMANLAQSIPPLDTESILKSIRPFATKKEGELIDRIMNIFSMQKFFKMYQTMQSMMSMMNMSNNTSQQSSDFTSEEQPNSEHCSDENSCYDTYWSNYYDNADHSMNNNDISGYGYNTSTSNDISKATSSNPSSGYEDNNFGSSNYYGENNFNPNNNYEDNNSNSSNYYEENNFNPNNNYEDNNFNPNNNYEDNNFNPNNNYEENNSNSNNNYKENNSMDNSSSYDNSSSNTPTYPNMQMLEMLSSIIPPEQKSTFDTMKLLIESGMLK